MTDLHATDRRTRSEVRHTHPPKHHQSLPTDG